MKELIVFIAFVLIFSMCLVFCSDMTKYMRLQRELKVLAEDCAEAGALTIDEETELIDPMNALDAALDILKGSRLFDASELCVKDSGVSRGGKGFYITLELQADSTFRSGLFGEKSIVRHAEYAWEY